MKGKVFESSMDVYQDQASVLFDFYLNAAQKIIDQEDALDNQCGECQGCYSFVFFFSIFS